MATPTTQKTERSAKLPEAKEGAAEPPSVIIDGHLFLNPAGIVGEHLKKYQEKYGALDVPKKPTTKPTTQAAEPK